MEIVRDQHLSSGRHEVHVEARRYQNSHRCLDYVPDSDFVQQLLSSKSLDSILPSVRKLDISFASSDSLAAAIPLNAVQTLESLTLTLCRISGAETVALHPEIFTVIGALPCVKDLDLRFGGAVTISYYGLATLLAGHHINHLTVSCAKRGRHGGEAHVHITAHDLLQIPMSLRLFETLESFNVSTHNDFLI